MTDNDVARSTCSWPGVEQLSIAAARYGNGELPPFGISGTSVEGYVWGQVHDDKRQASSSGFLPLKNRVTNPLTQPFAVQNNFRNTRDNFLFQYVGSAVHDQLITA